MICAARPRSNLVRFANRGFSTLDFCNFERGAAACEEPDSGTLRKDS